MILIAQIYATNRLAGACQLDLVLTDPWFWAFLAPIGWGLAFGVVACFWLADRNRADAGLAAGDLGIDPRRRGIARSRIRKHLSRVPVTRSAPYSTFPWLRREAWI